MGLISKITYLNNETLIIFVDNKLVLLKLFK